MSINDIPLGRLKEILASDMPLTIVTTEALITRLEQAEENLESALEANKRWAHRSSRERSELFKAEAAVARVREMHRIDECNECSHCMNGHDEGILYPCDTIRALDGEQS